jgi:hypothetical protein
MGEEEDDLQMMRSPDAIQRLGEEEEELQTKPIAETIQRMGEEEEDLQMKPMVQRVGAEGGSVAADLEGEINSARGGGQTLAPQLQAQMGQAMGADFRGVRVHTDGRSDQLNQSIQARAFTTGQDIFFRQGAYEPSSPGGQNLIAHELTHVVQQNGGAEQRTRERTRIGRKGLRGQEEAEREAQGGARRRDERAKRRVIPNRTPEEKLEPTIASVVEATERSTSLRSEEQWRFTERDAGSRAKTSGKVVQRAVVAFDSTTEPLAPPKRALVDGLIATGAFTTYGVMGLREAIGNARPGMFQELKPQEAPSHMEVELDGQAATPPVRTNASAAVGRIGGDMFYIKTRGNVTDSFEGGHIIPHSLWNTPSPLAKFADDYANLVPMSRGLNIGGWAAKENRMREHEGKYMGKTSYEIDLYNEGPEEVRVAEMVKLFALRPDAGYSASVQGRQTIELPDWLPSRISWAYKNRDSDEHTESDSDGDVQEEVNFQTHGIISTANELRGWLVATGVVARLRNPILGVVRAM